MLPSEPRRYPNLLRLLNWRKFRAAKPIRDALSAGEVLLYDASGNPILRGSDMWTTGEAEWRRLAHQLLDDLLDKLAPDKAPRSPEELAQVLKKLPESDGKYTFDVVDGKITLPVHTTVRGVQIKGHIPLYRIGAAVAAAGAGVWLTRKKAIQKPFLAKAVLIQKPAELQPTIVQSRDFPTWRSIKIGTYKSSNDLAETLKTASVRISDSAAQILTKVVVDVGETEIQLVRISDRDLCYKFGVTTPDVYASKLGLDLVPAETGPQILLQCRHQPMDEDLRMAMKPIADPDMDGLLKIFVVRCFSPRNVYLLDVHMWYRYHPTTEVWGHWVFRRRKQN